jgi:c-di-GMP-binding flagellar brake protein YcgR
MQDNGIENRSQARRSLRTRGTLLFTGNQPIPIRTLDVSLGGLCLVADIAIPAKIMGQLEINLPLGNGNFEKMQVSIQVVYSIFCNKEDGFRLGVLFVKPPRNLIVVIQKMFKS